MSSTYNIGRSAKDISIGQRVERYTQVVVRNEDGKEYSAGSSDGAKLVVECPWASDDMAQSLLSKIGGIEYRPFTATGAYVDPLAELGDTISVSGMQSAILSQDINFNSLMTSTVSAPGEEELEHEYEYTPKIERELARAVGGLGNRLTIEEQGRYKFETGVREFADITEDEDGNIIGELRGTSIISSITDTDTRKFKEAFLKIGAGYRNGELVTLSTLYSELIELIGKVQILNGYLDFPVGSAGIWIHDGAISVGNSAKVASAINYLTCIDAYATKLRAGPDGFYVYTNEGEKQFAPEEITSYNPDTGEYKERTTLGYKQGASPVASE